MKVNELVKKSILRLSIDDLMNINHILYNQRLREYFTRVNVKDFNSDVLHDINGLKYEDEHFVTRL